MESTTDYAHYFATLNELREQGEINMMSAPSMLRESYDLERDEAYNIFKAWTESFKTKPKNNINYPVFPDEKEEDPNGKFMEPVLIHEGNRSIVKGKTIDFEFPTPEELFEDFINED
tara:strand:+ start:1579 stop:1929 length:351 start_codon:yes stop_codon:yes gene_type:complete